ARERLIEEFWPETDPDAGRHSLRTALASLRSQLEREGTDGSPVLIAGRNEVRLNTEAVTTDVQAFEAALAIARKATDDSVRRERLAQVADLYQGHLLPGYYEPWVLPQMLRLEELYFQAVD